MQETARISVSPSEQGRAASRVFAAARIAAFGLASAIVVLSVVPPDWRPETGAPNFLEHSAIYAISGGAFGLGFGRRPFSLAIWLVIFAGCVEIVQLFVPGRHARLSDFLVDAFAACVGLLTVALIRRVRARI